MMHVCAVKLSPNYFSPIYGIGEVKWSDVKVAQLYPTLCNPMDYMYSLWNSPGQNTGAGSLSLLQGIFPTQVSNPGLPHCRQIVYQLSHREAQEYWSG